MKRYFLLLVPVLLAACEGNVQETLGLNREAPDEFTVVSRPPLTVPPEFALTPPRPGEAPLGFEADDKARALLTGGQYTAGSAPPAASLGGGAAANLLKKAGAAGADSSIREKLGVDVRTPTDTSNAKTLLEKISGTEKNEPTVDAAKEAARLKTNKQAGKPINEGEVPETKPGSESLIDNIF